MKNIETTHIKISRLTAGLLSLLFLWSCQKDFGGAASEEASLVFTVRTGEAQTRGVSDGSQGGNR